MDTTRTLRLLLCLALTISATSCGPPQNVELGAMPVPHLDFHPPAASPQEPWRPPADTDSPWAPQGYRPWRYIVIHHSATDDGNARQFDKAHRRRGWDELGYHFVIDNGTTTKIDGQIEASPRWIKQMDGAHCNAAGMNQCGIGICLVGDFTHHPPSQAQMDSLVLLVNILQKYYRIPLKRVIGHRDVPGKITECPGKSFPWDEFKRRLRRGR